MTTERAVGMGVEGDREVEVGEGWTKCKKGGRQYGGGGGLHKIRRLAPLCQLCKETLKTSHPLL